MQPPERQSDGRPRMIGDDPLAEASTFNFDRITGTLLDFISHASHESPLSVCIDGTWGSGKTTVLRSLEAKITRSQPRAHEPTLIPLWFEPWKLSSASEVLNSLVSLVLGTIEADAGFLTSARIDVDSQDVVRFLSERFLKVDLARVSRQVDWAARLRGSYSEVEALFRRIAGVYLDDNKARRRLVVFVDDLDRCPQSRVVEVLETVKLFFDVPGFIFIFAMDRTQVLKAIRSAYTSFSVDDAEVYLEKIFQLVYSLPQKEADSLIEFVSSTLASMGINLESSGLFRALVETYGRNLRNLKLFINSFSFQRQLIGANQGQVSDEALFKWIYLEAKLPRSLNLAIKQKSLGLAIALELLAQGGCLEDPSRYNRYARRLQGEDLQYVPLIIYSLTPMVDDESGLSDKLSLPDRTIVDALRSDGNVVACFDVLREGKSMLLDNDLSRLAYLTRREVIVEPPEADADDKVEKGLRIAFDRATLLTRSGWKKVADTLYNQDRQVAAYFPYLMALMMAWDSPTYWTDVGSVFRRTGRLRAAKALFRIAHQLDADSTDACTQMAYMFDIDLKEYDLANLFYRKAVSAGSNLATLRGNLAVNLGVAKEFERAWLHALDAFAIEPENADRRKRAADYARRAGVAQGLDFSKWSIEFEGVLEAARADGRLSYQLSPEEEVRVVNVVRSFPDLNEVRDELRSLTG